MDVTAELEAGCSPEALFAQVDDLTAYPSWLEIVARARPVDAVPDDAVADEPRPAWVVDLRGRLGPLARSKRLRMVRTVRDPPRFVRFERHELDGRDHAPWVLDAAVTGLPTGSRLTMSLHYGGTFGGRLLERMLVDEIARSRPRLRALVEGGAT